MTWLEEFQEYCNKAPDNYLPEELGRFDEKDVDLGIMPPHLVKVLWVMDQLYYRLREVSIRHNIVCQKDGSKECQEFERNKAALLDQIATVKAILFTSIRSEMNIDYSVHGAINIVQGLHVVSARARVDDARKPSANKPGPVIILGREMHD